MGEKKETEQRTNNLPDLSPNISLITVNANCLNTPQKPQIRRVDEGSGLDYMLFT